MIVFLGDLQTLAVANFHNFEQIIGEKLIFNA